MKKRIFSAIIALMLMVSIMAGCSSSKNEQNAATSTQNAAVSTQNATAGSTQSSPVTISWMVPAMSGQVVYNNDFPVIKEISKNTNVNINFISVPVANYKDKYNLVISSGDMPDVVNYDIAELKKSGMAGAFVPLWDLIDKNAPNLKNFYESDPNYIKNLKASDGKIFAIPRNSAMVTTMANFMRKDWLDNVGITKVPETLEEMEAALIAFRDKDPNKNGKKDEVPYATRDQNSLRAFEYTFTNPFGISTNDNTPFTVENGKLVYGPTDPRFKDALIFENHLFSEGLLDKELFTSDPKLYDQKFAVNKIGSVNYWIGYTVGQNDVMKKQIPTFEWVGIPALKGPGGDKMFNAGDKLESGNAAAITINNKYPVETIKFFDYIFSPEGTKLNNFGLEGTDYVIENGEKKFTDLILKNEKYPDKYDALNSEGIMLYIPQISDNDAWWLLNPNPEEKRIRTMYEEKYLGESAPWLSFSKEDQDAITKISTDAVTYKNEMEAKFIMGEVSIDKFDDYVANMKKIGVDQMIDIYNKAYQAYLQQK